MNEYLLSTVVLRDVAMLVLLLFCPVAYGGSIEILSFEDTGITLAQAKARGYTLFHHVQLTQSTWDSECPSCWSDYITKVEAYEVSNNIKVALVYDSGIRSEAKFNGLLRGYMNRLGIDVALIGRSVLEKGNDLKSLTVRVETSNTINYSEEAQILSKFEKASIDHWVEDYGAVQLLKAGNDVLPMLASISNPPKTVATNPYSALVFNANAKGKSFISAKSFEDIKTESTRLSTYLQVWEQNRSAYLGLSEAPGEVAEGKLGSVAGAVAGVMGRTFSDHQASAEFHVIRKSAGGSWSLSKETSGAIGAVYVRRNMNLYRYLYYSESEVINTLIDFTLFGLKGYTLESKVNTLIPNSKIDIRYQYDMTFTSGVSAGGGLEVGILGAGLTLDLSNLTLTVKNKSYPRLGYAGTASTTLGTLGLSAGPSVDLPIPGGATLLENPDPTNTSINTDGSVGIFIPPYKMHGAGHTVVGLTAGFTGTNATTVVNKTYVGDALWINDDLSTLIPWDCRGENLVVGMTGSAVGANFNIDISGGRATTYIASGGLGSIKSNGRTVLKNVPDIALGQLDAQFVVSDARKPAMGANSVNAKFSGVYEVLKSMSAVSFADKQIAIHGYVAGEWTSSTPIESVIDVSKLDPSNRFIYYRYRQVKSYLAAVSKELGEVANAYVITGNELSISFVPVRNSLDAHVSSVGGSPVSAYVELIADF